MKSLFSLIALVTVSSVCMAEDPAPKRGALYLSNAGCLVDGKPGRLSEGVLLRARKISDECYRPPQPTAEDAKSPWIGKVVSYPEGGNVRLGTVIQYVGATNEVLVEPKFKDGPAFRISASMVTPENK